MLTPSINIDLSMVYTIVGVSKKYFMTRRPNMILIICESITSYGYATLSLLGKYGVSSDREIYDAQWISA